MNASRAGVPEHTRISLERLYRQHHEMFRVEARVRELYEKDLSSVPPSPPDNLNLTRLESFLAILLNETSSLLYDSYYKITT